MIPVPASLLPFADGFSYSDGTLAAGTIPVSSIIERLGTPTFIYNLDAVEQRYREWRSAFDSIPHRISYAVKANSSLALLQHLALAGCGFDVNSSGELERVLRAGASPRDITMTGVGKTENDIRAALRHDILFMNVESYEECRRIQMLAEEKKKEARLVLRINPEIDVHTHPYIATGLAEHKFGLCAKEARIILPLVNAMTCVRLVGFGMHIGSQLLESSPFHDALKTLRSFMRNCESLLKEKPEFLNLGGGIGVRYKTDDRSFAIREFIGDLEPLLRGDGLTISVEPGRHLVANAGILVTRVLYVKKTSLKVFIIVDAGMNDLMRPALYDAHHEIHPVHQDPSRAHLTVDVVGPVCETGDFFALGRTLPEVVEGDLLAIFSAGAYGASMSSRYNSRPLAAEVVVTKGKWQLARARESFEDMVRNEILLSSHQ